MRYLKFLFIILCALSSTTVMAQSTALTKAAKAVFTLTTYRSDGSILAVTHGAYYGADGEGIAAFKPFIGAATASIIDAAGNSAAVETIIGANEMYDICRFTLSRSTGVTPLQPYVGTATGTVQVAGYSTRKATFTPLHIASSEPFAGEYNYYIFTEEVDEDIMGCPILAADGTLLGLVQQAGTSYAIHSTDARYYNTLTATGLATYDAALQKTAIRAALPTDREQARLMLLTITAASDSLSVVGITNDFIARYPSDIDGYNARATYEVQHSNFALAETTMNTAVKKASDKGEAYYTYAKLIYNTVLYSAADSLLPWTLTLAKEMIERAISVSNDPMYEHLLAQILFSEGDYVGADAHFLALTTTAIASSDLYYERAQCRQALGGTQEEVLALLDAAVAAAPVPLTVVSAPYILVRGMLRDEMEDYAAALDDYNLYDSLMVYRADDTFYYTRAQCLVKVRQYEAALNDFSHAVVVNPREVTYLAELAALEVRLGRYDEALQACALSFNVTTDYADIYLIQGLALHHLARDEEARTAWQQAQALGDTRADAYLSRYLPE